MTFLWLPICILNITANLQTKRPKTFHLPTHFRLGQMLSLSSCKLSDRLRSRDPGADLPGTAGNVLACANTSVQPLALKGSTKWQSDSDRATNKGTCGYQQLSRAYRVVQHLITIATTTRELSVLANCRSADGAPLMFAYRSGTVSHVVIRGDQHLFVPLSAVTVILTGFGFGQIEM